MVANKKPTILWVDCIGGLLVGMTVLSFASFFSRLDGLPIAIIRFVGFANLIYGSYSLWLTTLPKRKLVLVNALAFANMAWLFVCIAIVFAYWNEISAFGVFHKLTEGFYVATLGALEWKWRHKLADASP